MTAYEFGGLVLTFFLLGLSALSWRLAVQRRVQRRRLFLLGSHSALVGFSIIAAASFLLSPQIGGDAVRGILFFFAAMAAALQLMYVVYRAGEE